MYDIHCVQVPSDGWTCPFVASHETIDDMPLSETDCAATYKVLIVGDAFVGKTALLRCLMGYEFAPQSRPTVGNEMNTVSVNLFIDQLVHEYSR